MDSCFLFLSRESDTRLEFVSLQIGYLIFPTLDKHLLNEYDKRVGIHDRIIHSLIESHEEAGEINDKKVQMGYQTMNAPGKNRWTPLRRRDHWLPGGALKQGHKTEKNQDNENPDPIEKMLQVRQDVKRPRGPAAPASIERHKARRDPGFKDHLNKGEDVFVPSSIHVIRIRIYNPITPIPDGPNNTIKNTLKNLINTNIAT
ncbi:hypothetical protein Tco_0940953 [Tanacetum coccineum]|uniref:Uncharacterized protein n=1 Tax=Tanacetum coccineum TaxID=301880 RepID=A0ABQ5DR47_9ASTR